MIIPAYQYASKHHRQTQNTWNTKNGAVALSKKSSINSGTIISSLKSVRIHFYPHLK